MHDLADVAASLARTGEGPPPALHVPVSVADTLASGGSVAEIQQTVDDVPGDLQLGRFTLIRQLGRGGMGVVYTAYDNLLDRVVAIKMVRRDRTDVHLFARVLREAKALAKLSHPNVVPIFDVGEAVGNVFIAMEYVEGPTLRAWIERRRAGGAGVRELLDVLLQAGRGLAAAHAAGFVHRDFKPDNVLVGADGRARVLDFGLVTRRPGELDEAPRLTLSAADTSTPPDLPLTFAGSILGTPAYMSPEQWLGRQADARSDQFSFCACAYEALYGVRPFAGDDSAALLGAIGGGAFQPGDGARAIPAPIAAALRRGLAFRPEDRFPDLDALLAALAADPVADRRRRLRIATLLVATAMAVVAVVLGAQAGLQRWRRAQREHDAAAALVAVDARIAEARALGDRDAAARLFHAFLEEPVHKDTRAVARAWLIEAARRRDDGASEAVVSAYARAFTAAEHRDDAGAALLGLAEMFRARLDWDGLAQVLALLDARHPERSADPALAPRRAEVALALRDYAGARDLLAAGGPATVRDLAATLTSARSTGLSHAIGLLGRVGDELWVLEHSVGAPVVHALRADATLAPLWSHALPASTIRVEPVDPRAGLLVTWDEPPALYARADGGGLRPVFTWPGGQIYAAAAADLDGDGRRELYVGTGSSCELVELTQGGDGWTERVVYGVADSVESAAYSMHAVDLDRDGRDELAVAFGGWRAYDVRILRKDPASGRLVAVARDKLGHAFGLGAVPVGGEPLVIAEVFRREPNFLVFPPDRAYGEPPGNYLLALDGGRLVRRRFVPFVPSGQGPAAEMVHRHLLVGDANGDGRADFVNHYRDRGRLHTVVQLQEDGGGFTPAILDGVELLGFAQLDDDRADELLVDVGDDDAAGRGGLWALGVGDERVPPRVLAVPEDSPARGLVGDPALRRGFADADDLRRLGLFADAADAYEALASRTPPGELRGAALADAAALRERLGQDLAALALYRQIADPAHAPLALRGAYRSHLRLGTYDEALGALAALRRLPGLLPDDNADLIVAHERLAHAVEEHPQLDITFDRPLPAAWSLGDPLALRRRPLAGALEVRTTAPGVLAELPITWDGESIDVAVDMAVDHTEWSAGLTIELVPETGPPQPVLQLTALSYGTSRGGQPALRQYQCQFGRRTFYVNHTPLVLPQETDARARFHLRAFAVGPLGEYGCGLADRDGGEHRVERDHLAAPLGPPGDYRLVVRSIADVPAWFDGQIERISLRGARVRDVAPADPDRAELRRALVEGAPLAALAALDRLAAPTGREQVARARLLTRLGRLAEAEPLWRALLESDDPEVRGGLHTLLRGDHAEVGPVLRAISEPRYLDRLAEAWRNTAVNHLDDPRVRSELLDILSGLEPARMTGDADGPDALLRAVDLLGWRARLLARTDRRAAARVDFTRAIELCRRAARQVSVRAALLHLDLASLLAVDGDATAAREQIRAAREASDMPLLVEDIVRARPELAGLGA